MNRVKSVVNVITGIYFEALFALFIIAWAFLICLFIFAVYP